MSQREKTPLATPRRPRAIANLVSDWLGVKLEARSLCYWPTPQTGNQRIEEGQYRKYGRVPIGPPDIIRIVLISNNIVL